MRFLMARTPAVCIACVSKHPRFSHYMDMNLKKGRKTCSPLFAFKNLWDSREVKSSLRLQQLFQTIEESSGLPSRSDWENRMIHKSFTRTSFSKLFHFCTFNTETALLHRMLQFFDGITQLFPSRWPKELSVCRISQHIEMFHKHKSVVWLDL